jgi:hypothetical protein
VSFGRLLDRLGMWELCAGHHWQAKRVVSHPRCHAGVGENETDPLPSGRVASSSG